MRLPLSNAFLSALLALGLCVTTAAHAGATEDLANTLMMGDARIKAGNGHAAQELCSRSYVSSDWPARVRVEYVWPRISPLGLVQVVDMAWRDHVSARLPV